MKPLATPVLGGMVSSLLHVLIVTPVIFFWIRQRRLGLHEIKETRAESREKAEITARRRVALVALISVVVIGAGLALWKNFGAQSPSSDAVSAANVVRTIRSGNVDVVLLSPTGVLRQGRNTFTIEFRSADSGTLVDAGSVRASANMPMPGMVMSSGLQVQPTGTPGRYRGSAEFGMAGGWQMTIDWDGAAGRGSASFEGAVQ
jgi:hypothetical protein